MAGTMKTGLLGAFVPAAWLLMAGLCPVAGAAQEQTAPPQEPQQPAPPVVRRIGPRLYQVGAVRLDAGARTIRCRGRVNMSEGGPLELLACLPTGKTHESVLTLSVRPMDLQVALLLLGLNAGRNPAVKYPEDSPELARRPGDEVLVYVEWRPPPPPATEEETVPPAEPPPEPPPVRVPAEQLLLNVETGKPPAQARWVFLGSRMVGSRFGADIEGSLITTFHDPLGILELQHPTVNDDIYYQVHSDICPPVGTPVEVVIQAPPRKQGECAHAEGDAKNDEAQEEGVNVRNQP